MSQLVPAAANPQNVAGTGFSAFDLFGVMVAKRATEVMLMPIVGNSTWKSSIVKGLGAVVLYAVGNSQSGIVKQAAHITAAGMAFDAFEDASIALLGPDPLFTLTHLGQPVSTSETADAWATISY